MRRRTTIAVLITAASVLAACGDPADDTADPTLPAPAAEAPSTEPALTPTEAADETDQGDAAAPPATEAPAATEAPQADEPAAEPAEEPAAEPATEPADEPAPEATEAPAPEPEPVPEAVIGGRAFASEVTTDSTVLPDLLVDDINRGQKINLQNVFPAERPVLFWAFAPH